MNEPHSPAAQLFGSRVRAARITLGLSQESIAELAQMHVTNFGKIERGMANPSLTTILRIACVLGTDVSELTAGMGLDDLPAEFDLLTAQDFIAERDHRR